MTLRPWYLVSALCILTIGCNKPSDATSAGTAGDTSGGAGVPKAEVHTGKLTKLGITDVKVGTGAAAKNGDDLNVSYTGSIADGTIFDSTDAHGGKPFELTLGQHSVIKGWEQGLVGMKEGGERKLAIPSELGYGAKAQGDKIPANSDLYFDVKLVNITPRIDPDTVSVQKIKEGTSGPAIGANSVVSLHYVCTTTANEKLDEKDENFKFGSPKILASVQAAIKGWRAGSELMVTIPPALGPHFPMMPPNAAYKFDITIKSVK